MSQLGPLAGGLFLTGGAIASRVFAESEWAKTSADMLMHLASDEAGELFGHAVEGFRGARNSDIEKSMQQAALQALAVLRAESPAGYDDWFAAWHRYLTSRPASEVFAGTPDLDPLALEYDDGQFRALWWQRMEQLLAGWRNTERSPITRMHLSGGATLPGPLADFLRTRLIAALEKAHRDVLRDPELDRSWIAFQQHAYHATLDHLRAIRDQLDRMERKLDSTLQALDRKAPPRRLWTIGAPVLHFQDRPELVEQVEHAMANGTPSVTALFGLGGIGKTELARSLAWRRRERYKFGAWIEAETTVSLLGSLSKLAPLLGIPAEQDQQALVVRVLNELSSREPWLLIFDNADSPATLRPYVSLLSGNGDILITSRNEQWDGLAKPVNITQWSEEESARFLLQRTGQTDQVTARLLASDLGGLVLALEHAAAYMLAGDRLTLATYRNIWREKLKWIAKGTPTPIRWLPRSGFRWTRFRQSAGLPTICCASWLGSHRRAYPGKNCSRQAHRDCLTS